MEEILIEDGRLEGINWEEFGEFAQLGSYHAPYKDFIRKIPELLASLRNDLQDRKQATMGMACHEVAGLAGKGELQIPPAQNWIFSGFNVMNACEKKLFCFFMAKHKANLILRTDPQGLKNPRSPFHLQAETIDSVGMSLPAAAPVSSEWNDLAGRVTLHACTGVENEIFLAFRMLEEICRGRDDAALRKVAILLPSSPTLIPFVQGAISRFDQNKNILPFNITLGYPLERTPMMQLVDSMLTVLENTDGVKIKAGDYLQLIRHPYVKISGGGNDREPLKRGIHLLENMIQEQNLTRFSMADLNEKFSAEVKLAAPEISAELAAEIENQVGVLHQRFIPAGIHSFQSLLAFLRRALESVCRQDVRQAYMFLNEYAATTLKALAELEDFASAQEPSLEHAKAAGMAALVRNHFRGRTINFVGSPLQGVQVMGPLEFRGLSFDEVLVLDALEGILPGTAKYDPILPADIRRIFEIRDHGDWERVYAFNFFAMLGAARRVHIFYPRKSSDGQECERSRFIERIVYEIEKRTGQAPAAAAAPMPFSIHKQDLKRVKKSAAILARIEKLSISPSALESFVRCPLQFYFNRVLRLRQREEVAAETEGGLIGSIAHETLSAFYDKYKNPRALAAAKPKTLDDALQDCLFTAFHGYNFDPEKGLERIRSWALREQLRLFVRADRLRIIEKGIQVEKREESLSITLEIPNLEYPLQIKGRLDRWETDGKLLRVIDYKTGSAFTPKVRLQEELDLEGLVALEDREYLDALGAFRKKYPGMQLQIYLMLLSREKNKPFEELDAAYVFLREKEKKMMQGIFLTGGRSAREFTPNEKRAAMDAFAKDLNAVLTDIHQREYFIANPGDERYCSYCPFRLPCGNL